MSATTTITPNFQVHIPVDIREKSGITTHGTALISAQKNKIIITKAPVGFLAQGGKFQVKKPVKVENLREFINLSEW